MQGLHKLSKRCLYWSLLAAIRNRRCLVLPYPPSAPLYSFPNSQFLTVHWWCRIRQTRKVCSAPWRRFPILHFLPGFKATVPGFGSPEPTALRVLDLNEVNLSASAPLSPGLPVAPAFPDWSRFYSELSWTDIRTHKAKKRRQTFHARSKRKRKQGHLSIGKLRGHVASKHHLVVNIDGYVIDRTVSVRSFSLSEDAVKK